MNIAGRVRWPDETVSSNTPAGSFTCDCTGTGYTGATRELVNKVEQHISNIYNVLGTGFNIEFSFASRHVVIIVQMLDRL